MYVFVIAAVLIIPVAVYFIRAMQNFEYRAPVNYMLFAVVGALAPAFGFLTAFRSLRTTRANPVESHKYE